jgi:uncharacterized protein (DUF1697 family)
MIRYVAFLRGINVGGHKLVKMDALRRIFEDAGHSNVATYIQSGNVVFDSAERDAHALEEGIEGRLREALGFEVAVLLRTFDEVAAVVRQEPFAPRGAEDGATVYVTFMREKPGADLRRSLTSLGNDDVEVRVKKREVFVLVRRNVSAVDAIFSNSLFGKKSGGGTTTRNLKTLSKIVARFGE